MPTDKAIESSMAMDEATRMRDANPWTFQVQSASQLAAALPETSCPAGLSRPEPRIR
jgi:hypothetical protein